jgi:hypothetical protein
VINRAGHYLGVLCRFDERFLGSPCYGFIARLIWGCPIFPAVKGVKASANLYSLIETAKANGLEPYVYLRYLFAALPKAQTVEAIEALL